MTREEAIGQLKFMLEQMPEEPPLECDYIEEWLDTDRKIRSAFKTAIKALEQEGYYKCLAQSYEKTIVKLTEAIAEQQPSEDCVSRQAVKEVIMKCETMSEDTMDGYIDSTIELEVEIDSLPPVTPTRKKGKWIDKSQKSGCGITFIASECTCCGKKTLFNCNELIYRYCPNCGAEMESKNEYNRQND